MEIKPRKYKNIEFRSTLEAKWARFFDLLGWSWKYEPFKLIHGTDIPAQLEDAGLKI